MEEAARYNLIIKWFIGIPVEDSSYAVNKKIEQLNQILEKRI
jgi:hypothetical protein